MASCSTSQWGNNYSPQAVLNVTVANDYGNSANLYWTLDVVFHGYALSSSVQKSWSINVDGQVRSGNTTIGGVTGTKRVADGYITVGKNQAARSVGFSVSFAFNATWNGSYSGTRDAWGSIGIGGIWSSTVSYNANGGTGAPGNQTKWYGSVLTLSNVQPTRTGYSFKGWGTSSTDTTPDYQPGGQYGADSNITLYAIWQANTYTVKYDANGGTGAPANQTKTYGVTLKLSTTQPTRTNYNFLGWGTSASSTTVAYAPGANYTGNAAITLYAVWEIAYTPPKLTNFTADRCTSDGTISDEGTYVLVKFNWTLDSVYSSGLKSITIGYKLTSASTYTNIAVTATGMNGSVTKVIGSGSIDTEYSYDIQITVTDDKGSSSANATIAPLAYAIDFKRGGTGVAIGKPAANDGFEVSWPSKFEADVDYGLASKLKFGGSTFLQAQSNGRPTIMNHIALANGMYLQGQLANGSFTNILRMNSDGQVELNWTSGGMKGRVMKTIWSGSWNSGSITIPELPYYTLFVVRIINEWSTMFNLLCVKMISSVGSNEVTIRGGFTYPDNTNNLGWLTFAAMVTGDSGTVIKPRIYNDTVPAEYWFMTEGSNPLSRNRNLTVKEIIGVL